jgi:hypothetical protein
MWKRVPAGAGGRTARVNHAANASVWEAVEEQDPRVPSVSAEALLRASPTWTDGVDPHRRKFRSRGGGSGVHLEGVHPAFPFFRSASPMKSVGTRARGDLDDRLGFSMTNEAIESLPENQSYWPVVGRSPYRSGFRRGTQRFALGAVFPDGGPEDVVSGIPSGMGLLPGAGRDPRRTKKISDVIEDSRENVR